MPAPLAANSIWNGAFAGSSDPSGAGAVAAVMPAGTRAMRPAGAVAAPMVSRAGVAAGAAVVVAAVAGAAPSEAAGTCAKSAGAEEGVVGAVAGVGPAPRLTIRPMVTTSAVRPLVMRNFFNVGDMVSRMVSRMVSQMVSEMADEIVGEWRTPRRPSVALDGAQSVPNRVFRCRIATKVGLRAYKRA